MVKKGRPTKSETDWMNRFSDKEEMDTAKSLKKRYLKDFVISTTADENTLNELIYFEVIQIRLQKKLNDYYQKDAQAIPQDMIKTLQENSKMITSLKTQLGVNTPKDMEIYDALQHLRDRHKKWRQNNQVSRHLKCPHCFQLIWLKMRTEAWEACKHPFFKDTFLYNEPLFNNLGKKVLIDRFFISSIFGVSPDYIDFFSEKMRGSTHNMSETEDNPTDEVKTSEVTNIEVTLEEAIPLQSKVVEIKESNDIEKI